MAISFTQIPISMRTPGVYGEVDTSQMMRGVYVFPTRVLIVGQMLAGGTATPLRPIPIFSTEQAWKLFGRGSQLARMIDVYRDGASAVEMLAMALADDAASAKATGAFELAGIASAAGTINAYVGARRARVGVKPGDTASMLATLLAAEINANADMPVTATAAGATVTMTARNGGEVGNTIMPMLNYFVGESLPAGVTITHPELLSGGTGNPDIQPALDAIVDDWITDIVQPYNDAANLMALERELEDRFSALRMQETTAYGAVRKEFEGLIADGRSRNCGHMYRTHSTDQPLPDDEYVADMYAAVALALSNDPARPVQTLAFKRALAPAAHRRFKRDARDMLLHNGIATTRVDAGGNVTIERLISGYRENAAGAADTSLLDIEDHKIISFIRYDLRMFFARKYPRHKLAKDGTSFGMGQPVMTPKLARAEIIGRFSLWEEIGLVQDRAAFERDMFAEIDVTDPDQLNAFIPPECIGKLRKVALLIQPRK